MSNHIHMLVEVPPMHEEGISDQELLKRLSAIYSEAVVADVARKRRAGSCLLWSMRDLRVRI